MKYLRIDKFNSGTHSLMDNYIVIFPNVISHDEIASHFDEKSIISAGFVHIDTSDASNTFCYGESTSLGIRSMKDDTTLFKIQFGYMFE